MIFPLLVTANLALATPTVAALPYRGPAVPGSIIWNSDPVHAQAPAVWSLTAAESPLDSGSAVDQEIVVVSDRSGLPPGDPFEHINAQSFAVTQRVDRALVGPVALAYKKTFPEPVRDGLRNALNNLREPSAVVNFLLQIKPGKAALTLGRFAINSTIGGAGLFDMAKRAPFNLPRRRNGFADTMGYYGVGPGPYMFLPLVGPTTLRDLIGGGLDRLLLPMSVGKPFNQLAYTIPTGVVSALDHRAEIDVKIHQWRDKTADPYAAFREAYLQQRQAEIDGLRGPPHVRTPPTPAQ